MNNTSTTRAEAERLLGISEKLLQSRDFTSSRDFAILAQENEPLLDGSDQILAVTEVLLASSKRVNNKHYDWYAILQLPPKSDDLDQIKKQYRRLALLLHPDKNKYAFADHAFKFVADAWAILSDPNKKVLFDNELSLFSKVNLVPSSNNNSGGMSNVSNLNNAGKMPVRRNVRKETNQWRTPPSANDSTRSKSANMNEKEESFWTACPYCYVLYEYPNIYEECCLKCQSCSRGFHAAAINEMPPLVPGKEAYYTCWGFFPLGFSSSENGGGKGFPNWMPSMFGSNGDQANGQANGAASGVRVSVVEVPAPPPQSTPVAQPIRQEVPQAKPVVSGTGKKRGRPRKYPM